MILSGPQALATKFFTNEKIKAEYPSLHKILISVHQRIINWNLLGQIFNQAVAFNAEQKKPIPQNILASGFIFSVVLRIPMNDPFAQFFSLKPLPLLIGASPEECSLVVKAVHQVVLETIFELQKHSQNSEFLNRDLQMIQTQVGEAFLNASRLCLQQCQNFINITSIGNQMEPAEPAPRPFSGVTVNQDARERRALAKEKKNKSSSEYLNNFEPIAIYGKEPKGVDGTNRKVEQLFVSEESSLENMSAEQKVAFLTRKLKELNAEHQVELREREVIIKSLTTEVGSLLSQKESLIAERDGLQVALGTLVENQNYTRTKLEETETKYNILLGVVIGVVVIAAGAVFGPKAVQAISEALGRK